MATAGTDRVYCSDLARAAMADPAGTMEQVDLWVLLEVPRPWQARATTDNALQPAVQAWLDGIKEGVAAATGLVARVLFVKQRTSTDQPGTSLSLAFSAEQGSRLYRWQLARYAELTHLDIPGIAAMVQADMADADTPAPVVPSGAHLLDEPMVLVCTNGKRDLCCARFGLPLFEALATELGEVVWQTSHIGGHRYAPNMVCLPQGSVYGFVGPEQGPALVAAEAAGQLDLAHLRGRSFRPKVVQAAEVHLRRHLQQDNHGGLLPGAVEIGHDDSALVQFAATDGRRWQVSLRAQEETIQASCGADGVKATSRWLLAAVTAL